LQKANLLRLLLLSNPAQKPGGIFLSELFTAANGLHGPLTEIPANHPSIYTMALR